MKVWYSKSLRGWVNETDPVEDKVEISEETYHELMKGQESGKMIGTDENGYPILVEYPRRVPSPEKIALQVREKRNQLLAACDWIELPSASQRLSPEKIRSWLDYRQALRDITQSPNFPSVAFPDAPN